MFKCHFCGEKLSLGTTFTFECNNCNCCKLSFNKHGKVIAFNVMYINDIGERYFMYLFKTDKVSLYKESASFPFGSRKMLFQAKKELEIIDYVPQVEKLFLAMQTLVLFK